MDMRAEILLAGPLGRDVRYEVRTSGPFTPTHFRRLIRALECIADLWEEDEPPPSPQDEETPRAG